MATFLSEGDAKLQFKFHETEDVYSSTKFTDALNSIHGLLEFHIKKPWASIFSTSWELYVCVARKTIICIIPPRGISAE